MKRILAIALMLVFAVTASASVTNWTGASGANWNPGSWDNGAPAAGNTGVLGSGDVAKINAADWGSTVPFTLDNGAQLNTDSASVTTSPLTIGSGGATIKHLVASSRTIRPPITLAGDLTANNDAGSLNRTLGLGAVIGGTGDIYITAHTRGNFSGVALGGGFANTYVGTTHVGTAALPGEAICGYSSPQNFGFFGAAGNRVEIAGNSRVTATALGNWTNSRYDFYGNTSGVSEIRPSKTNANYTFTMNGRTISAGPYDASGDGTMRIGTTNDGRHYLDFTNSATLLVHVHDDDADTLVLRCKSDQSQGWEAKLSSVNLELNFVAGYDLTTNSYTIINTLRPLSPVTGTFANDVGGLITDSLGNKCNVVYNGGDGNDVVISNLVPIPEPATLGLLGVGGVLVLVRRRRRR